MQKLKESFKKRGSQDIGSRSSPGSPEGDVVKNVRSFCDSNAKQDEEILFLPVIVEAASASPTAAKEAAYVIRKVLVKDASRSQSQYNAIMLIRILSENPGPAFARGFDSKFQQAIQWTLRHCKHTSVHQFLCEVLDYLESRYGQDETFRPIIELWRKEKAHPENWQVKRTPGQRILNAPPFASNGSSSQTGSRRSPRGLPPPGELAERIEEAKTSAKLLLQLTASTPTSEIMTNELVLEFSTRCQSASRSIAAFINASDPAPDDDTMLTLIETNEQLSLAISKHQRAVLNARKAQGSQVNTPTPTPPPATATPFLPPRPAAAAVDETTKTENRGSAPLIDIKGTSQQDLSASTYTNSANPWANSVPAPDGAGLTSSYVPAASSNMPQRNMNPFSDDATVENYTYSGLQQPLEPSKQDQTPRHLGPRPIGPTPQRQVSAMVHTTMRGAQDIPSHNNDDDGDSLYRDDGDSYPAPTRNSQPQASQPQTRF